MQSFAEAVRHELKDTEVTITALTPRTHRHRFFDRADMGDTPVQDAKKDDPAAVARDGFQALMAGKDHVIGGSMKYKLQTGASKLLSDPTKAAVHARMTKPKSECTPARRSRSPPSA